MSFLKKLFSISKSETPNSSPEYDFLGPLIGDFTYLIDYRTHYGSILGAHISNRALAEIYLFRGWTTQLGYRIYSRDTARSDNLSNDVVTFTMTVGQQMFISKHGFSIEMELGSDYLSLVNSRWQAYDKTLIENKIGGDIPASQIIGNLNMFMGINDTMVSVFMEMDFLGHMVAVKNKSIQIGLM
jgi:hypothetical protein